jgi:signal peptidase I
MMFCGPMEIPEKNYLMLGDNRGNSQDGRYWGLLPQDRFIGKAVFLFWPFTRVKKL